jgi:hypothetical protein
MDLYSYASGDPVNNLDPDGRCSAVVQQVADQGIRWPQGSDALTQSLVFGATTINKRYSDSELQPLGSGSGDIYYRTYTATIQNGKSAPDIFGAVKGGINKFFRDKWYHFLNDTLVGKHVLGGWNVF